MTRSTLSCQRTLVIGAGAWGTALASVATHTSQVLIWARQQDTVDQINHHHRNPRYLGDIPLPSSLQATTSLDEAIAFLQQASCAFIIFAVPVAAMRPISQQWLALLHHHQLQHIPFVWTCKGFEEETGLLPHEVIAQTRSHPSQVGGVLSGPSFAKEVAQHLPVALTVASTCPDVRQRTTHMLHAQQTRIYDSDDVIGVEVGGAIKNVMAVACGVADGLGLGNNARAAIITRGLTEIQRLGVAMQGRPETFFGLTGLGDLVLTATGDLSRNRQVGLALGQGKTLDQILSTGLTAEGVRCARAAYHRAQQLGVSMPITHAVCDVLFNHVPALQAVTQLLARQAKSEVEV